MYTNTVRLYDLEETVDVLGYNKAVCDKTIEVPVISSRYTKVWDGNVFDYQPVINVTRLIFGKGDLSFPPGDYYLSTDKGDIAVKQTDDDALELCVPEGTNVIRGLIYEGATNINFCLSFAVCPSEDYVYMTYDNAKNTFEYSTPQYTTETVEYRQQTRLSLDGVRLIGFLAPNANPAFRLYVDLETADGTTKTITFSQEALTLNTGAILLDLTNLYVYTPEDNSSQINPNGEVAKTTYKYLTDIYGGDPVSHIGYILRLYRG